MPDIGRRDRHQRNRRVGADSRLKLAVAEELRAANSADEVPHSLLNLWLLVQPREAKSLLCSVDLRSGVRWDAWLRCSAYTFSRWNYRVA